MSAFSGKQGKGAMKARREQKRREAEERNATAFASRYACGHVHGERVASRCPLAVAR